VAGGLGLIVAAMFGDADSRKERVQVAAVAIAIGAAVLAFAWRVERATPR